MISRLLVNITTLTTYMVDTPASIAEESVKADGGGHHSHENIRKSTVLTTLQSDQERE